MSGLRLVLVAGLLAALPANPCQPKPAPIEPPADPPPPPPPPSSTRPPTWQSTQPTGDVPTGTGKAEPPSDLTRAKASFDAKDYKRVKSILESKVKGGKSSPDEMALLADACKELKDKPCLLMLKKAQPAGGGG